MQLKDILVYLDDGVSNSERVKTAFSLAQLSQARLTGVALASIKPAHLKVSDAKAQARISEQEAMQRVDTFAKEAEQAEIAVDTRVVYGDQSSAARKMAQIARNFDLVILRQANPSNPNFSIVEAVAEQVILLSGRPVFFMPYIGAHRIPCQKAMIAWDGTPAAARAVHDALPLLKNVEEVIILVVKEGKKKTAKGELLVNDLAKHLKHHKLNVSVKRLNAGTFDVPTVILNEIAENDIDLLVMGGYGTPSLQQKIFGGVTTTLLKSMIIPVIMSH
ncbi:MAG: universal stress protein [Gammaproteobacteria bacterium]|nr:universal stress protein [Gammaproteobacteria bacterium]MBL7000367.1 universal stress protein [Gammaproteobacteria bacterium]